MLINTPDHPHHQQNTIHNLHQGTAFTDHDVLVSNKVNNEMIHMYRGNCYYQAEIANVRDSKDIVTHKHGLRGLWKGWHLIV